MVAPLLGIAVLDLVFWAPILGPNAMDHLFSAGVLSWFPVYILTVTLSVPVFLLARKIFGWSLRVCLGAAALVVLIEVALIATVPAAGKVELLMPRILIGAAVGTLVFGVSFWGFVRDRTSTDGGDVTSTRT